MGDVRLIKTHLLAGYLQQVHGLTERFEALQDAGISTGTFSFYTSVSAMASSKIEGEQLEIDSYIKHKMLNIEYKSNLIEKPNDLYNAYLFAQSGVLTKANFLRAHAQLSRHLLPAVKQGRYRKVNMLVMEHTTFRIQFEPAPWTAIEGLMKQFWKEINHLLKQPLGHEEVFYYAGFIHLVFVNIHPFEDGNGRSGRLLEKWFVAQKLGAKAWYLQSELYYHKNVNDYYKNLNRPGLFYEKLDYTQAMPFLLMLPECLEQ